MAEDYRQLTVRSRTQWRSWLTEHHATDPGVWVITNKKGSGRPHVPYEQIVVEAPAYGWVDSRPRKLDDQRSQLLVTPASPPATGRASTSNASSDSSTTTTWRRRLAAVDTAKANGAWNALDDVEQLKEPDDLRAALDQLLPARNYWNAFPPSTKRAILEWIGNAKRPETRQRRVRDTAQLAAQNTRANQWRQPKGR